MYRWRRNLIPRFYGLNTKTNVVDVHDSISLDALNVFQNKAGVISKRRGNSAMFSFDLGTKIDEIGQCTLDGTKYYFTFSAGNFYYTTTLTGALTTITPSPTISTTEQIFWAVLDDKLFFVDNTNSLRYFDGTSIKVSSVYARPTNTITTSSGGTGFDYVYTVDNGLAESPALATASALTNKGSAITVRITVTGYVAGDIIRIYSRATTVAAASKLVATHTITAGEITATFADIVTVAITDDQPQLYTELGEALNISAPLSSDGNGPLRGITVHYGRLVGWRNYEILNSKSSNPHSWPDDTTANEAFRYLIGGNEEGRGDGQQIKNCTSYRENLFVFKLNQLFVLPGIGPTDTGGNPYSLRRVETNGIGCVAPKSVSIVGEGTNNFLVFLSKDGFYATDGSKPSRVGEVIENFVQYLSESNLERSVAFYHKKDGFYVCAIGDEANRTVFTFDTRKDENTLVGWFKWSGLNWTAVCWDDDKYLMGMNEGNCANERFTITSSDFSDVRYLPFTASDVTTGTDSVSKANHGLSTGDVIQFRTTGTAPSGLTAGNSYYAIVSSSSVFKFASSLSNAQANIAIDLTTTGSGNHSVIGSKSIDAYYTTNWINFKDKSIVKKLAKPMIMFNAQATSINLEMSCAYDWVDTFQDLRTISITSSHLWGNDLWGSFIWGSGIVAQPKNVSIARRKCRSIRYKFANNTINQDFDLLGLEQEFAYIRNRGDKV